MFPTIEEMSVLDLGGTVDFWSRAPIRPRALHLVNLEPPVDDHPDWMRVDVADACAIPAGLLDDSYDLVYSNSVIEHVGGHRQRQAFARQVLDAGPAHWVQTPYRYFPVEPHWVAPLMQFFPLRTRAAIGRVWPLGTCRPESRQESIREQMEVELLDITQMRHYFPESTLVYERMCGLVKSIIATSRG